MRITRVFEYLSRLSWKKPSTSDLIIFDTYSERHLRPFFRSQNLQVFDTTFPIISIWVLLNSLKFGWPSSRTYLASFVNLTRARLVITTIDNSPLIYQIKTYVPSVCVIVIQNGRRDTIAKYAGKSFVDEITNINRRSKCQVDYFFTFGSTEAAQFRELIDCDFVSHGSLKNNLFEHTPDVRNRVLTFISSFTLNAGQIDTDSSAIVGYSRFTPIPVKSYFEADFLVAKWLNCFAEAKGLQFQILGKRGIDHPEQELLFRSRVPGDWSFIYCNSEYESYKTLLDSEFVAGIDSTLLYEMFGRGKKTAFFTIRKSLIGIDSLKCPTFGYPEISDDSGPMWTNLCDFSEFERVMETLLASSDSEWTSIVNLYSPFVMKWDPGNESLVSALKPLGIPLELNSAIRLKGALNSAESTVV